MKNPKNDIKRTPGPVSLDPKVLSKASEGSPLLVSPYHYLREYIELFPKLDEEIRFWLDELNGVAEIYNPKKTTLMKIRAPQAVFKIQVNDYYYGIHEKEFGLGDSLKEEFWKTQKDLGREGPILIHKIKSYSNLPGIRYYHPACGFIVSRAGEEKHFDNFTDACNYVLDEVETFWEGVNQKVTPFFVAMGSAKDSGMRQ